MKKVLLFLIVAALLVACGGNDAKNESNSITLPAEAQVGELGNYVTFPKELKIKIKEEKSESSSEQNNQTGEEKIKTLVTVSVDVTRAVASNYNYGIELTVVDADYSEICKIDRKFLDDKIDLGAEWIDRVRYSHKLAKGPQHLQFEKELTPQEWEDIKTKGAYFIMKAGGMFEKFKADGDSSSDEPKMSSSDNSSDGNLDDLLDSFESYIDKYISLMRKAKNGDASAMSEYPDMLEEAQNLGEKIQNAKGQLTGSQLEKYQRINNKMLQAAQELQ